MRHGVRRRRCGKIGNPKGFQILRIETLILVFDPPYLLPSPKLGVETNDKATYYKIV